VSGEYGSQTSEMKESRFHAGLEDVIIFPLVLTALAAKNLFQAALSILIRILDYAFPIVMQLARLPLFTARILGDGVAAALKGIVRYWPASETSREKWREFIGQKWSWLRQKISYKSFEDAVHRMFEGGMAWVFKKCRNLTPDAALLVIAGAVLWLPVSFGAATAIHAVLLAKAASLPAWMQLLHPFATLLAKSKLLVLPVYPAAWPQAKKHPLIQAIARGYREFKSLHVVQKTGYRYRQTERATQKTVDVIGRAAAFVGLRYLSNTLLSWFHGTAAWIRKSSRDAMRITVADLSRVRLIGSIVRNYAARYSDIEQRSAGKPSERMRRFFERWSIKFSAEYYEAKEREQAAKGRTSA
jgi:hypothetical protein